MHRIEELLRKRIGLDVSSIGSSVVRRTVRLRMKDAGVTDVEEYLERLTNSDVEWRLLIEAVVVSETWFFRDSEAFRVFKSLILSEWLPGNPLKTLRVLSLPCSTGEEPYSIAMTLMDAGFPMQRAVIDAVDVSDRALESAREARYGKNSFRGKALSYRDRYFATSAGAYVLSPLVQKCVNFRRANLLEEGLATPGSDYDFIFCRNLLIYFDRETQLRALALLREALNENGLLFVGPAELPLVRAGGFMAADYHLAFACRKTHRNGQVEKDGDNSGKQVRSRHARRIASVPSVVGKPAPKSREPAAAQRENVRPDLDSARKLADAGELDAAQTFCERFIREVGPSVEVYYLLGLILDSKGDPQAMDCYRKAIYLKPDHHESLLQLALLMEKNGDPAGAATYRHRAERVRRELSTK